jgi:hypothetical protein
MAPATPPRFGHALDAGLKAWMETAKAQECVRDQAGGIGSTEALSIDRSVPLITVLPKR